MFKDANLTRAEQRQTLAIMGSALSADDPMQQFLRQVEEANHNVTAPDPESEVREWDETEPVWHTGNSSSWRRPTPGVT